MLVVFSGNEFVDIPYTVHLDLYYFVCEVGNILRRSFWNDSREYEHYFNFVKWFNEADGGNYDVSPYVR